MNRSLQQFLILLLQSVIFWITAFIVFLLFRYYGVGEEQGISMAANLRVPISQWFDLGILLGLVIGIIYAIIETLFEKYISKKVSLGLGLLLKTILYLITLISSLTFISMLAEERMDIDLDNDRGWWRTDKTFWMVVLFFLLASLVFSFIKISNEKFGRGVFLKMLLGKYRKPKEEKHIFMFLDLKSSTTIAENLGHIKYSEFIQDCFYDLNMLIDKFSAQVYQYVGDEAVLYWPYEKGTLDTRCIDLFFAFQKRLEDRKQYYSDTYNWPAEFKAGLHGGLLTIAEVGTIKKELAFHGDVINTTARIQDECNKRGESLLISDDLLSDIKGSHNYTFSLIGEIDLRGKEEKLNIQAIRSNK